MNVPVVLACRANSTNEKYLPSLKSEMDSLEAIFRNYDDEGVVRYKPIPDNATTDNLFDAFTRYRKGLLIFHYSGHAEETQLIIEDGPVRRLNFLGKFAGILPKLVFLNGCCTEGFVEELLDIGVEAVIATSTQVRDAFAAQFAARFYGALLSEGNSLHNAFIWAHSETVNDLSETDQKAAWQPVIYRGIRTGSVQPSQWRLHCKEGNEQILAWTLPLPNRLVLDAPASVQDLEAQRQSLLAQLQPLRQRDLEQELNDQNAALTRLLQDPNVAQRIAEVTSLGVEITTLKNLQQVKKEVESRLNAVESSIQEQTQQDQRREEAGAILPKLREIDHKTQLSHLGPATLLNLPGGAFVLQGSSWCGIDLLHTRLLKQLRVTGARELPVELHAVSSAVTWAEEAIWQKIGEALGIPGRTTAEILTKLREDFYPKNHLVLLLKNLQQLPDQTALRLLKDLWTTCLSTFGLLTPPGRAGNTKLILIAHDNVSPTPGGLQRLQTREAFFQLQGNDPARFLFSLPGIRPFDPADFQPWLNDIDQLKAHPNLVGFQPPPDYVLRVIEAVCEKSSQRELFKTEFSRYKPIFEPALFPNETP